MKNFQRFCVSLLLTLMIALTAFAGDMDFPGVTSTPPPPSQTSATGDMTCPGANAAGDMQFPGVTAIDPMTEITLDLLQSLMSLL
ncbi:MAG TPA: hypothetical protein VF723_16010 [Pyrinomonadaceae bacterium]|jgi:hypothetical protein